MKINSVNQEKINIFFKNGKKLIDTSFCSGTLLLGHSKNFLNNSFIKQLKKGVAYGLQIPMHKYSLFLKKIFGNYSKFILCNTGSEANNKAIRLARSIKKEYIVMTSVGMVLLTNYFLI